MSSNKIKKICCIGAGYVGGPTMSVIADKCPDLEVRVVDINKERIAAWNNTDLNKLPIFEPGLDQIIARTRGRNLFFSSDMKKSISEADMIFISVNTPTKAKGLGAGQASDLSWVEASARQVAKYAKGHTIVIEKSTLPVRTAQAIKEILKTANRENHKKNEIVKTFSVLSNPGSNIGNLLRSESFHASIRSLLMSTTLTSKSGHLSAITDMVGPPT